MVKTTLLGSILVLCLCGCGPRQPATMWGYSHWYQAEGGGSMGTFEELQKRCLEQVGASSDPASVEPNSPQENLFIQCMNGANWCTDSYNCNKPGT